ncbi:MAG TPA: RNA polymerase sigma factor [Galbitalea sp.]
MSDEPHPDDLDVVRGVQIGDVAAFETVYLRHATVVMRYAYGRLRDRSLAEDVLQQTFLTVWAKRSRAVIVDRSLLPWILAITGNHIRNAARQSRRRETLTLAEVDAGPADDPFSLIAITAALATLSDVDRRVCELCLAEGHTYGSAARELGLTEGAVRKRLQRARTRLQTQLRPASERGNE